MTIEVGASSGGGSIWPMPPIPTPIKDGVISLTGNIIPHNGALVNQIKTPTAFGVAASGEYEGLLDGVSVWTVAADDVNGACTGWFGIISHWYDSVNDRLYVFGKAVAVMYTAYIDVETGAITNVGNDTFTISGSAITALYNIATSRPAIDSGNFTMIVDNRLMEISESDGSEVSNVSGDNTTSGELVGIYASLDGTITVGAIQYFTTPDSYIAVTRNGVSQRIATAYYPLFQVNLSQSYFCNWGDKVKVSNTNTGLGARAIRTFNRAEFDAWLVLLCEYAGI